MTSQCAKTRPVAGGLLAEATEFLIPPCNVDAGDAPRLQHDDLSDRCCAEPTINSQHLRFHSLSKKTKINKLKSLEHEKTKRLKGWLWANEFSHIPQTDIKQEHGA